jgi:hypothetical protein
MEESGWTHARPRRRLHDRAWVLHCSHSQPLDEGSGLIGVIREVTAQPHWADRLAAAPFTNQQHRLADVAAVMASEGMDIVEQDTELWKPAGALTGLLDLAGVAGNQPDRVRAAGNGAGRPSLRARGRQGCAARKIVLRGHRAAASSD